MLRLSILDVHTDGQNMADTTYEPPPLRKVRKTGEPYKRLPRTEKLLQELAALPINELAERAKNHNRKSPDYVPSEVLVHRLRLTRQHNSELGFGLLFEILEDRIRRVCPQKDITIAGGIGEIGTLADLQENVLERFTMLILQDRQSYEERLDIFEVVFDRAVAKLKASAGRKVYGKDKPLTPLEYDETGDVPTEVEESLDRYSPSNMTPEEAATYRFQLRAAIDKLPENERRILDMQEAGIQDQAKAPGDPSISKILGCTDKTVRNRRKSAFKTIREALGIEVEK